MPLLILWRCLNQSTIPMCFACLPSSTEIHVTVAEWHNLCSWHISRPIQVVCIIGSVSRLFNVARNVWVLGEVKILCWGIPYLFTRWHWTGLSPLQVTQDCHWYWATHHIHVSIQAQRSRQCLLSSPFTSGPEELQGSVPTASCWG